MVILLLEREREVPRSPYLQQSWTVRCDIAFAFPSVVFHLVREEKERKSPIGLVVTFTTTAYNARDYRKNIHSLRTLKFAFCRRLRMFFSNFKTSAYNLERKFVWNISIGAVVPCLFLVGTPECISFSLTSVVKRLFPVANNSYRRISGMGNEHKKLYKENEHYTSNIISLHLNAVISCTE